MYIKIIGTFFLKDKKRKDKKKTRGKKKRREEDACKPKWLVETTNKNKNSNRQNS